VFVYPLYISRINKEYRFQSADTYWPSGSYLYAICQMLLAENKAPQAKHQAQIPCSVIKA